MKFGIVALFLLTLIGCQSPTSTEHTDEMIPEFELGTVCMLKTCPDCSPVSSCPLAQQEMKGMSCSCTTINGIQTGIVQ